jgi:peptidoglycan/xylan/chitin deacetylase (PgdA/CDA1 family)
MAADGLIRFGNHTDSHRKLPWVDEATLLAEVSKAELALAAHLPAPSRVFAFPNGEYDLRAVGYLRQLGYRGAVAIGRHLITAISDPMRLGRVGVNDIESISLFALRLSGAVSLARQIFKSGYRAGKEAME